MAIRISGTGTRNRDQLELARRFEVFMKEVGIEGDVTVSRFYSDRWYSLDRYEELVSLCKGNTLDFESSELQFESARDCMARIISEEEIITRIVENAFWDYMRNEIHGRYGIPKERDTKTKLIAEVTIESPMVLRLHDWF